ncbi:MAG: PorP/SprF family type IX secretion system membrane protein [Tannerellaceae bacterium]|jgi:type IX secretion system PorP/SprF family membrane protein|nr:PorP/SprF family type IX secretion system membrane protein [Tannerellaceae bacterium]
MRSWALAWAGLWGVWAVVHTQTDAQFSQHFAVLGYYNPAAIATAEDLSLTASTRAQWLGFEGAPVSIFGMADRPLRFGKREYGIGVTVFSETIGLYQTMLAGGQGAYKRKLWGGLLSVGLQAGFANISFEGSKVHIPDNEFFQPQDEAIPNSEVNGTALDLNAGLFYTRKQLFVGIGVTHLTAAEIKLGEKNPFHLTRGFNFVGGYNIPTDNPLFEWRPSAFLKTDLQSWTAEVAVRAVYNKMFEGGVSWRMNESVIMMFGGSLGQLWAGYAYDFPLSGAIRQSSFGSHEIVVRYLIKLSKTPNGKGKHKSVRIL